MPNKDQSNGLFYLVDGQKRMKVEHMEFTNDGYIILVLFLSLGHRVGYVGVPKTNILHGIEWQGYIEKNINVHGGVTFSDYMGNIFAQDNHWFIGFDCGHAWDNPDIETAREYGMQNDFPMSLLNGENEIRDFEFVLEETQKLYNQLKEYEKGE